MNQSTSTEATTQETQDEDERTEQLIQSQYLSRLLHEFIARLPESERTGFERNIPKLKKIAVDLIRIINAYAIKEKLHYYETLFVIDCFYRTVTWDAYKKIGESIFAQTQKSEDKGYV